MTGTLKFRWDDSRFRAAVARASERTLNKIGDDAHEWWLVIAPVGESRKGHEAGELRDSWFAVVINTQSGVILLIGASARYAIYVELGTSFMEPRAPIRQTAGEVAPLIPYVLRDEMAAEGYGVAA